MSNEIKGKGQRLIPEYLLKYLQGHKDEGIDITELVDSSGNPRFLEGDITLVSQLQTMTYGKWSLSGSHLMIVIAGNIESGTTLTGNIARVYLPQFILNKIYPLFGIFVSRITSTMFTSGFTTNNVSLNLEKSSDYLSIVWATSYTVNDDFIYRFQFDLLIDTE